MTRSLITQTVWVGLLLLTGCEASRNMRDDLLRLTSSQSTAQKSQSAKSVISTRPRTTPPASTPDAAVIAAPATSDQMPALPARRRFRTIRRHPPPLRVVRRYHFSARARQSCVPCSAHQPARRIARQVNDGAIETGNALWISTSTRTFKQNSSELLRTI
jgi:hypothetical protein